MVSGTTAPRPRVVEVGYWLFLLAAVAMVLLGLLALTVSHDDVRAGLTSSGRTDAQVDALLQLVVVQGGVLLLGGLVVGFLAAGVRRGDPRFRRAEVALSGLLALVQLGAIVVGASLVGPVGAVVAVVLLAAGILVCRPAASPWFARA